MAMTFATDVNTNGYTIKLNKISAPTTSGGSTYGAGTSGQVLKSNGTAVYWANAGGTSTALSLTATAAGWSNATPPTQSITATGVTASNNIAVGEGASLTTAQRSVIQAAQLACTAQAANSITLTCYGTKPTIDLPITVVILG